MWYCGVSFFIKYDAKWKCLHLREQLWKEIVKKGSSLSLMLMNSHLDQKGLIHHQECSIPPSLDPMLLFSLMRITSDATPLLERVVDQSSLFDTDIPKWIAHKDWNYHLLMHGSQYMTNQLCGSQYKTSITN